ncbi:TRAP transporter large permease [Pikeienuella sp. HZG-20]|uniref:TRAP transporter large permease n=1 Tax=Paludibacillus litoralis TaxID=3133267 RepID=UPI0030EBDDEB
MSVEFAALLSLFAVLLVCGTPIAVAIGLPSAAYIFLRGWPPELIMQRLFNGMDQFLLLAVPLFMLAGELMNSGGLTTRLVNLSQALVGHIRGSLAMVNLSTNMLMAGISGSAIGDASAVGSLLIPKMAERGYPRAFAAAVTAAGSIVGPIIPPSVVFILYAVLAGASVIDLFLAGIVPGILIIVMQMTLVYFIARRRGFPVEERFVARRVAVTGVQALPVLVLPVIIVGGIRVGAFTATEGAAAAVAFALMLGLAFRALGVKSIGRCALEVGQGIGEILLLIGAASILSFILVAEKIPQSLTEGMLSLTDDPIVIILIVNITLLVVGMFLDGFAALIIFVPILLPLAKVAGFDPIHFGVVIVTNIMIGIITPPLGICLFVTSRIAGVPLNESVREILPFIVTSIIALLVITYIPAISLTLPHMLR